MISTTIYAMISVMIVSLVSLIASVPLMIHKKISKKVLIFLLSISVGVMLGTVFFNFLPEMHEYHTEEGIFIIIGFLMLFVLEKLVHWHHTSKCEKHDHGHHHAYHLAPLNLIGDGVHNFIDGLVISGSYAVSTTLGIAATISIIFHEAPQEIADFGVLLYSGYSKKKAVIFNFMSAATAIIGTIIGLLLSESMHGFSDFIIPFAAGNFIYIAASNLVPELHRHCKLRDTFLHVIAILMGVGIIIVVGMFSPGHAHG